MNDKDKLKDLIITNFLAIAAGLILSGFMLMPVSYTHLIWHMNGNLKGCAIAWE